MSLKTNFVSAAGVNAIARAHSIPKMHRESLAAAIDQAALAAYHGQIGYILGHGRDNPTGHARPFEAFIKALTKAKKLLSDENVRARLAFAGSRLPMGAAASGADSFELPFIGGDNRAAELLDELIRLAEAGRGSAKEDRASPVESGIIEAAAELALFWKVILKRDVLFNDWNGSVNYLEFVDDVLSLFWNGKDFSRYVRDRKSKVVARLNKRGPNVLASQASAKKCR